jgi:hypothetical protein
MKWQHADAKDPTDPESDLKADNIEEAYKNMIGFSSLKLQW